VELVKRIPSLSEFNVPHGPGIGFVPAGTRFEIFHRIRKMARRVNPIPKETPKYWRMPIVAVLQKVYLYDWTTGWEKRGDGKVGDPSIHMEARGRRSWNLVLFGLAD
jgi:hypothetical protein